MSDLLTFNVLNKVNREKLNAALSGGMTAIQTIELTTAGAFDFTGLDLSGYDRALFYGWFRSDAAATKTDLRVEFNGDTTTGNYTGQNNGAQNGVALVTENNGNIIGFDTVAGDLALAGAYTQFSASIMAPGVDGILKSIIATSGFARSTADSTILTAICSHETLTAPLTQIKLLADGGAGLIGKLTLYGA